MPAGKNQSYIGRYSKEPSPIPGVYNGMRLEVLDRENELLFVADAEALRETMLELVRTSELLHPVEEEPLPVSIRGFNAFQNCGIHIDGMLSRLAQSQDSAWIVRELDLKGNDAGRSFSRQPIEARGWVQAAGTDGWIDIQVVNASAGGVCFRSAEHFEQGQKLNIRFRLRRGREQPPLAIAIRRISERADGYEYGSEFVDLTPEVETNITRTLIQLQIMQA